MLRGSMSPKNGRSESVRKLRECYRPARIRSLLVGTSPPDGHFFYDCTTGGHTVSTATREVFEKVYWRGHEYPGKVEFLCDFKRRGWYLHDLYDDSQEWSRKGLPERGSEAWRRLVDVLSGDELEAVSALFKSIEGFLEDLVRDSRVKPRLVGGLQYVARSPQVFKENLERLIRNLDGLAGGNQGSPGGERRVELA